MAKKKLYDENGNVVKGKMKKPFYKRVSFWVLVVIVGSVISTLGGEDELTEQTEVSTVVTESKTEDIVEESAEVVEEVAEVKTSFKVGDVVTVGNMEYTVDGIETATSVGSEYMSADANDTYLIIDLTVKNNGNKAVMVDSSFFKLVDGEKTFEADATGSMYANEGATTFFLESLNPDVGLSGRVVFDVSEAQANSETVKLKVSTGFFGTESEVIDLR